MVWLPYWLNSFKTLAKAFAAAAVLQFLILVPFIWFADDNYLPQVLNVVFNSVDYYPKVSMNAFNGWHLVFRNENLSEMPDSLVYAGLTYKTWGLLFFMFFSAITLFPLFVLAVRKLLSKQLFTWQDYPVVLLSCGLIPILFTYFNTQMHERYWHSAILFLAAYGFLTRSYFLYILSSAAYFFNMERQLTFLQLKNYSILFFDHQFIAGLFTIALLYGIWKLYRSHTIKEDTEAVWSLIKAKRNKQFTQIAAEKAAF